MNLNGLPGGQSLADFLLSERIAYFEIGPVRNEGSPSETCWALCSSAEMEMWSIYGRDANGFACLIHDIEEEEQPGQVLQWLHDVTGLPVAFNSTSRMHVPTTTLDLACWLTEEIHDELPDGDDLDARADDFDNHPLAPLRESICDASGYGGDPVQHPQGASL